MAPIYMTPPCSEPVPDHIRAGRLGMIATPAQGNKIHPDYRHVIFDNGVYGGTYPGDAAYLRMLATERDQLGDAADNVIFATAPDVVGQHLATWARSRDMLPRIRALGYAAALVAQDGMEADHSLWMWDEFDALFVGGSTAWKLSSEAAALARAARDMGKWVHVGRVNSFCRYQHAAEEMCAHSVDGTFLTNGPDKNLPKLLSWADRVDAVASLFGPMATEIELARDYEPLLQLPHRDVAPARERQPVATDDHQISLFALGA
jgi:hypothetical protein